MKKISLILCFVPVTLTFAGDALSAAIRQGAEASVRYQVVDEEGSPVSDATAHVWLVSYGIRGGNVDYAVATDSNGCFIAKGMTNDKIICSVKKDGYYQSRDEIMVRDKSRASPLVANGRWMPYGERCVILLKRIREPADLERSDDELHEIPAYGQWIGFDLEKSAWLSPYGKGKHGDVLLRFQRDVRNRQSDFSARMEVSFTNNPFGGIYKRQKSRGTSLVSDYRADTNAFYKSTADFQLSVSPDGRTSRMLNEDEYLVFRTRTKVDEEGRLVSAHYGMIYGRWGFYGGMRAKGIFFNPTPNDANLEPKRKVAPRP